MSLIDARHASEVSSPPLVILALANSANEYLTPILQAVGATTGAEFHLPPLVPNWLQEVLEELEHVDEEAREEGYGAVTTVAKENARQILEAVHLDNLPAPSVCPTEDREIAIQFASTAPGAAVLVLCDSSGGGACFSSIAGKNRRARFDDAADIPHPFLIEELQKLSVTR